MHRIAKHSILTRFAKLKRWKVVNTCLHYKRFIVYSFTIKAFRLSIEKTIDSILALSIQLIVLFFAKHSLKPGSHCITKFRCGCHNTSVIHDNNNVYLITNPFMFASAKSLQLQCHLFLVYKIDYKPRNEKSGIWWYSGRLL